MRCASCGHDNRAGAKFCEECGATAAPDAAPAEDALPASLGDGRYSPSRLLGEGSRKRVYLATDERLGREVAVAIIKTDGLDAAGRVRLAREARSTARLGDHPQIVTVHDVGEESDGTPYIVSQYMPGGSLADVLAQRPGNRFEVNEALDVAEGLASALGHAHELGIVHRDLKPANVWIAADGVAHLGDFGLAVPVDGSRITSEGMVVGTVAYLAPEQALGRDPDPRADLYGLGAVLYEMLAGRPPFLGDDAVAVISQHLNSQPVAPSWHVEGISGAVDAFTLRLLAKDPADRPDSASAVAAELFDLRTGLASAPHDPDAPPSPEAVREELSQAEWGRFVGRADELAQLCAGFDQITGGRGKVMMVVGEPGIGKTRLVEELGAYAAVRSAHVLWGHSYEGEVGLPYLPFVEALRSYVHRAEPDAFSASGSGLAEVATLVAEVRERHPDLPALPALDSEAERLRLFEGVSSFLRAAAVGAPIVVVLDDLHWCDKPSLLLLQHLARSLRDARVLLVGTYRDVELERGHPLSDAISNLRRQRLYDRVLLRGLPLEDVRTFIDAVGGQESPELFAELILRETEGNPFFVSEILRHLVETGAIRREGNAWVGTPESVAENLPEGVREVIGRRLDGLTPECNAMLTVAAAMPGGFVIEQVAEAADLDEDASLDLLDEALGAQVLRERRERAGNYEFSHALIRQTLYGELSTPRRVRLHRRIAAALETRYIDSIDEHLPELAYHTYEGAPGGDVETAVSYAARAAARAAGQAAHEEAVRYLEMALSALEHGAVSDEARRSDLLIDLAFARARSGDLEGCNAAAIEAAALGEVADDDRLVGRAALAYGGESRYQGAGADPERQRLLEDALGRLRRDPDPSREHLVLLSEVLTSLGQYVLFRDPEAADALVVEALDLARKSGDPGAQAGALSVPSRTGWSDEASRAERQRELVQLAEAAGDLELVQVSRSSLFVSAVARGEMDTAFELCEQYAETAEASRAPIQRAVAHLHRCNVRAIEGRYEDAEREGLAALEICRSVGDYSMLSNVGVSLYPPYREHGTLAPLESPTRRTGEATPEIGGWRAGLAHILAELGKLGDAADEVRALVAHPSGPPDDVTQAYFICAVTEAAVLAEVGDAWEAIDAWFAELVDIDVALIGSFAFHGHVDHYHGMLASALGRHDEAVARIEGAHEFHAGMGAVGWAARSQMELAVALGRRGGSGDEERAGHLLTQAVETANELGASRLVKQALAAKLQLQGVPSGSSPMASIDAVTASVTIDRPDLGAHAADDGQVTVCFSDIVGYTRLTDRLGDARTHELLRTHTEMLRRELLLTGGVEVKSEGDGFMLAFGQPSAALAFAAAFQRTLAQHAWPDDVGRIEVRMGMHLGEVIRDSDDFFGRTVIIGARVAARAEGGEVLVTEAVRAVAGSGFGFGPPRELDLKGLSGTFRVHQLVVGHG